MEKISFKFCAVLFAWMLTVALLLQMTVYAMEDSVDSAPDTCGMLCELDNSAESSEELSNTDTDTDTLDTSIDGTNISMGTGINNTDNIYQDSDTELNDNNEDNISAIVDEWSCSETDDIQSVDDAYNLEGKENSVDTYQSEELPVEKKKITRSIRMLIQTRCLM